MPAPDDDWHPAIPDPVPTAPSLGELTYEDFRDTELVGSGGDAEVYRATVQRDGRSHRVALKQPRVEGTVHADAVDRFFEEAETWASLDDHDNVVGVLDWGADPLPWIALEYADGGSLAERDLPLDLPEGLWVGLGACRAVRHAHRHGVAHLDLKPANVLFRETGPDTWAVPKVGDWGLAELLLEGSGSVEGLSPAYAAPEQFAPDEYGDPDDFTDVYGLGTVLYELFAGEPPFSGPNPAVMRAVLEDDPTPPSEHNPDLPASLDEVVLTALAKEKGDRHESALILRQALERVLDDSLDDAGDSPAAGTTATSSTRDDRTGPDDDADGVDDRRSDDSEPDREGEGDSGGDRSADPDDSGGDRPSDPDVDRRTLLKVGGGLGVLAAGGVGATQLLGGRSAPSGSSATAGGGSAGATAPPTTAGGGEGGDGGNDGSGGGDGRTESDGDGGDGGGGIDYGGWFEGVDGFDGTVDRRGESRVTVEVGVGDGFGFAPPAVRVDPGTTVEFEWVSAGHAIVVRDRPDGADWAGQDPADTHGAGYTHEHTFEVEGVYRYFCAPHKSLGAKGAVVCGDPGANPTEAPTRTPTATPDERRVRIGVLQALSGHASDFGREAVRGLSAGVGLRTDTLPVDEATPGDYVVRRDPYLELAVRDTEGDPGVARERAAALVEEGVDLLVGTTLPGVAVRVVEDVALPREVPTVVTPADTSGADLCRSTVFRAAESATMHARAGVRYLADNDYDELFLLAPDYAYGRTLMDRYERAADGAGVNVANRGPVPRDYSDFEELIAAVEQVGPDAVVGLFAFTPPGVRSFVREVVASDRDFQVVGTFGPYMLPVVGRALENALGEFSAKAIRSAGIGPVVTRYHWNQYSGDHGFVDRYLKGYDGVPGPLTAAPGAVGSALVGAVEDVESTDAESLVAALRGRTVDRTPKGDGAYEFQAYDNRVRCPMTVANLTPTTDEWSDYWDHPAMPAPPELRLPRAETTLAADATDCSL